MRKPASLIGLLFLLAGCGPGLPPTGVPRTLVPLTVAVPTTIAYSPVPLSSTPTRHPTYRTTPTRTATPTLILTSTPSPTSPAALPEAIRLSDFPPLPADLYFLRGGQLWLWASSGGEPQALAPTTGGDPIVDYQLTPDGRKVAYLTEKGQLYVLDTYRVDTTAIPQAGPPLELTYDAEIGCVYDSISGSCARYVGNFALTPDGRFLVYIFWQSDAGSMRTVSGSIRAIDLQDTALQYDVAYCGVHDGWEFWGGCGNFLLAPDGSLVLFTDGQGVWVAQVPDGQARLLMTYEVPPEGSQYLPPSLSELVQWSPDGQRVLVRVAGFEWEFIAVLDVGTGQVFQLPDSGRFYYNHAEAVWGATGIWLGRKGWPPPAMLYLAQAVGDNRFQVTYQITETQWATLSPRFLHPLPDGRIAFANRPCPPVSDVNSSGIFLLQDQGQPSLVAPLPGPSCCEYFIARCWGHVFWTPDGAAFVYTALGTKGPAILGLTDGTALWDVRQLLAGATLFRWGLPIQP